MVERAPPTPLRRGERIAGYAFGALFVLLGIVVLVTMDSGWPLGPLIAGLALLALGLDALWRISRGRRPLLTSIGALP